MGKIHGHCKQVNQSGKTTTEGIMKKLPIIVLVIILFPTIAIADSAKEAVRALKKLEARCQTGISYKDYAPALGDAKFEVNLFIEGREATKKPELTRMISQTMKDYEMAQTVWAKKFSDQQLTVSSYIFREDPLYNLLLQEYPDANKSIKEGGVLQELYNPDACKYIVSKGIPLPSFCIDRGEFKIDIDRMVNFIWTKASERLKTAMRSISDN